MENSEVALAITRLCDLQLQQFQVSQELIIAVAAFQEVMKDRGDVNFQSDHRKKIQALKQGALGKQIAQDRAKFETLLRQLKTMGK